MKSTWWSRPAAVSDPKARGIFVFQLSIAGRMPKKSPAVCDRSVRISDLRLQIAEKVERAVPRALAIRRQSPVYFGIVRGPADPPLMNSGPCRRPRDT